MKDCIEEGARLRHLAELAIVEAPIDPLMEQLCGLACGLLDMPAAFVNIVDAAQAHIKAHHGHAYVSIPREVAFCDVAIRGDEPLIVPNLAADPRFAENPFVAADPHVRFYAGIPLAVAPGVRVGALCIVDMVPRELTAEQVACLQSLAGLVLSQIRHHASRQTMARQAIELARKQKILAQTAQLAGVGGFEVEAGTGAMTASDELCRLVGRTDLSTLECLLSRFAPEGDHMLRTAFARLGRDAGELDVEIEMPVAGDEARHMRIYAETAIAPPGTRIVGIVQDVTERKRATGELEWFATHDALTRVCNRTAFGSRIEAAIRRADSAAKRVALILLDVDRFKAINDTLGHDVGDQVLVSVANRLVAALGRRGAVARLGGDEFGILVDAVDAESVIAAVAGDILAALREPFPHEGHALSTRATLGIALSTLDDTSSTSLFKEADIALYEAKRAGRDGFALYRPEMRVALEDRRDRRAATRRLVSEGRFEAWYQPRVDLATNAIVGFEALPRFVDRDGRGALGPFADDAVEPDVAVTVGELMRAQVAADVASWRERGIGFGRIAFGVSAAEFRAGGVAERVLAWLARHELASTSIELEIAETLLVDQRSGDALAALRKLANAGVAIALDSFGTGLASLTHLRTHPIDRINIDATLVRDLATSAEAAAIVDAVARLALGLGLAVGAKGIEKRAQLDALRARECGFGQGPLLAKPMPGSRMAHLVRNWAQTVRDAPPLAAVG